MRLAVPKEPQNERRVALVPASVPPLVKAGFEVAVEPGCGEAAGFPDDLYADQGAVVAAEPWAGASVMVGVRAPLPGRMGSLAPGALAVSLFSPASELAVVKEAAEAGVTLFSLELLPRITRAQSMDALSSQATVTGYWGTLLAATRLPRFFPMLMTAAGTIPPAKVFVLGAGVAGLQAIATARRLGAVVTAHDVRPAAKGEVESLGARFVELPPTEVVQGQGGYAAEQPADVQRRQRDVVAPVVAESDVVIATAAIPGRRSPVVVTSEMVRSMKRGSVVVDLAADGGGNTELTRVGKEVRDGGVVVIGVPNPPGAMPMHASQLYSRNIATFVSALVDDGALAPDLDDEIVAGTCVAMGGQVRHAPTRERLDQAAS
ncbi:MAG: NAD(P) transhydrogenase subunit alpha [Actinomycetota bacterium]|nr:NAD(P) transhydrogenase subunit alpha [Actinomycetota bacterium]